MKLRGHKLFTRPEPVAIDEARSAGAVETTVTVAGIVCEGL